MKRRSVVEKTPTMIERKRHEEMECVKQKETNYNHRRLRHFEEKNETN